MPGAAGPPLGGLLFGLAAFAPFAVDAASYAYSLISTFFVRTSMAVASPPAPERIATRLGGGLRWIWPERLIRDTLLTAAGINAVFGALDLTVIVDARSHGATSAGIGVMLGIAGVAGFVGATLATRLAMSARPSLVVLGIFWVTASLIPLMAIDANPYILGVLLGAATLLAPAANTVHISHAIIVTPDRLQGRVDAAGNFMTGALRPLAPLVAGLLFTAIGGAGTLLAIAIAVAMGAIALAVTASSRMRSIPPVALLSAGCTSESNPSAPSTVRQPPPRLDATPRHRRAHLAPALRSEGRAIDPVDQLTRPQGCPLDDRLTSDASPGAPQLGRLTRARSFGRSTAQRQEPSGCRRAISAVAPPLTSLVEVRAKSPSRSAGSWLPSSDVGSDFSRSA